MAADEQDEAEALDEDKLEIDHLVDFPPDEPLGVDDALTADAGGFSSDGVVERSWREEPETGEDVPESADVPAEESALHLDNP